MEIQLSINGETSGPYTLEQVQAMLANGETSSEDYAWFDGCEDWITVGEIPGIEDAGEVEEAPIEEPEEEAQETPTEETANFYIWPEGAEDWAGPYTLAQIQDMLGKEEVSASDFAAYEGSSEGVTVADIPGIYETAQEEESTEEEAPAPAKKIGLRAKGAGLKTGGFGKKSASGFGVKKVGGLAKKSSGVAKKSAGVKKVVAPPEEEGDDTQAKGKGLRIATGILLILGLFGNLFVGSCSTFLGDLTKTATAAGSIALDKVAQDEAGDTDASKKAAKTALENVSKQGGHVVAHGFGLFTTAIFCLLGAIFAFMGKGKIIVLICGVLIALIGVWGIVAAFMTVMLLISTGIWNLIGGILAIFSAKSCR